MMDEAMKSKRIKILETVLRRMATLVVKKYQPIIVGITGSVGKSSAKEAIALVLGSKFSVRKNEENYNNEIGLPLTVIGAKSGKRSAIGWLAVVWKWLRLMVRRQSYPEVFVLEMGIDRPGDMEYLLSFLPLRVGVMTNVSSSHLEFFGRVENIAKEKGKLIRSLSRDGTAILCLDNPLVAQFTEKTKAKVLTYGMKNPSAMVQAGHFRINDRMEAGSGFKLSYEGTTLPVRLPHVVAEHHVEAVLAAVAAGLAFKMNLVEIAAAIQDFQSLPGRMRVIPGIRASVLLDDTYNASPASLSAALKTLSLLTATRRMAVLGDMLELGNESETSHKAVAKQLEENQVNMAYFVGERMLAAYESLKNPSVKKMWFEDPMSAAEAVRVEAKEGDAILVKGSQGMRMEKVSEALLAHPENADTLLCRQSEDWKKKPFVKI